MNSPAAANRFVLVSRFYRFACHMLHTKHAYFSVTAAYHNSYPDIAPVGSIGKLAPRRIIGRCNDMPFRDYSGCTYMYVHTHLPDANQRVCTFECNNSLSLFECILDSSSWILCIRRGQINIPEYTYMYEPAYCYIAIMIILSRNATRG